MTKDTPVARIPFDALCDMESPLMDATELARAIVLIAQDQTDAASGTICTLGGLLMDKCGELDRLRCEGFSLAYPGRAHFTKADVEKQVEPA